MMAGNALRPEARVTLLGRRSECAALDDILVALHAGESRVLVIRGAPGVGKSALLEYAVASAASDVRVLRAVGAETEMELTFAALHQLCAPLLDRLPFLPPPQSSALETVFGLRVGPSPDRFMVGLALLNLLREASQDRPLLCVVDDAQWLDPASVQVLSFIGRRLLAESICLVLGARESSEHLLGLPELEVRGLCDVDAHALLSSATHSWLDERVRDRIVAETRGNPRALLDVSHGVAAARLAGGFGLVGAGDPPGRLEQSIARRIEELPTQLRLLLLVAAADPVGDPALVWRAAERLGVPPETALVDAADGLLLLDDRVTFRQPLARSAVYRAAPPQDRRIVHRALAEVTDAHVDPDHRAWHLAAASAGPDENVAAELERSAGRARARGGLAAAAAFRQRALALTQDTTRRAERALAAAGASLHAGDIDAARRCLDTAERDARTEWHRARIGRLRAQIAFASGSADDACPLMTDAATRLEQFDPSLARETYLMAWGAAAVAGDPTALLTISRTADALPAPTGPTQPLDTLLGGLALFGTGARAAATPLLQRAVSVLQEIDVEDVLVWGWVATTVGPALWDEEVMLALLARHLQIARDTGALTALSLHLSASGLLLAWTGDLAAAAALVREAELVANTTGVTLPAGAALHRAALEGAEADASALITDTLERAGGNGGGTGSALAYWSAAVLFNGLARYPEALAAARASSKIPEPFVSTWALPELIEAATRSGDTDLAHEALERLLDATKACDTEWALGISARCRALLSDGAEADRLYREAVERLGRTRLRPEHARARLLHGEWLRRQGQRADARGQLRAAHDLFVSIGMKAYAERARRELLATGETLRRRTVQAASADELTPQQRQIALLVRDGLSNPEVGALLFLSPRTVEWHLRQIFTKLSITSRRQLPAVLPRDEWPSSDHEVTTRSVLS
jgi:DNA-binding CsgD family transcriptional regulator